MKRRYKTYIKANLMSIFFIIVSFISGTLAWFAYSGLSDVATEIDIRAWNIEIDKKSSTKDITISLSEISPGMETMSEVINIRNSGDSDAIVKFNLVSARILGAEEDNYVVGENLTTEELQDILANKYPFQINASLSKEYVLKQGGEASLNVSVSWPFDSGNDDLDSTWGTNAYQFLDSEIEKHDSNPSYKIQSPIEIILKLTAEQMTDTQTNVSDTTTIGFKGKAYDWTFYLDVFNNEIVGYDVRETMHGNGILNHKNALNDMLDNKIKRGYENFDTIVHTDQGSVYSSMSFNNMFNSYKVTRSMSRAGTPTDNPVIESKNGWMKKEMHIDFDKNNYTTVQEFIDEVVYDNNYYRPSFALNYKTPIEYRTQLGFK